MSRLVRQATSTLVRRSFKKFRKENSREPALGDIAAVQFTVRFHDLSLDQFDTGAQEYFKELLAQRAQVPKGQVRIRSNCAGSVVVRGSVEAPDDATISGRAVKFLTMSEMGQIFDESVFGASTIHGVNVLTILDRKLFRVRTLQIASRLL